MKKRRRRRKGERGKKKRRIPFALRVELERMRVVKEKLKTAVTRVKKECDELRDVNMTTAKALE